jgi:hypothetical protein
LALTAGFAAGLAAWGIGEAMLIPEAGFQAKDQKIYVSSSVAGIRNGSISFSALGAALGMALGIAGGLTRRSTRGAIIAGTIGLLVGGAAGVALTRVILPIYYEHTGSGEITHTLMVHGGIWSGLAAVAGLAYGMGRAGWRGVPRGVLGAFVAALLATVVYDFASGILFPMAATERPVSLTWQTRLLARLLVTLSVAAGVVACAAPAPPAGASANAPRQED